MMGVREAPKLSFPISGSKSTRLEPTSGPARSEHDFVRYVVSLSAGTPSVQALAIARKRRSHFLVIASHGTRANVLEAAAARAYHALLYLRPRRKLYHVRQRKPASSGQWIQRRETGHPLASSRA
eukprot:6532011-Pyramimonas_sp.AAC.2